jgi:hypothetical protein
MLRITALSLLSIVLLALAIYFRPRMRWVIKAWSEDGTCYAYVRDGIVFSWDIGHRTDATLFRTREAAQEVLKHYKRNPESEIDRACVAQIDATRKMPRFFTLAEMIEADLNWERTFNRDDYRAEWPGFERKCKRQIWLYRKLGTLLRQNNPYAKRNLIAAMVRDFN